LSVQIDRRRRAVYPKLAGKVVIITGSGQGIGKAIALEFARQGARVVTNSRKPGTKGGDAESTAYEIMDTRGEAVAYFGSVADFQTAGKLVQTAVDRFGRLDVLINNAGSDAPHMIWNMTEEEWDLSIDSYLKGTFNTCRHASALMREQKWGRILNTTSTAWLGTVGHCNYGAAKAGVVGLTRSVAREVGRYGVTCNAYAPTASTRFSASEDIQAGFKKRFESGLMTKERYDELTNLPGPETVAPFLVYLCTDAAADINGQVFDVTGGNIALYSEPVKKKTISKETGTWSVEELTEQVPKMMEGYKNPAPPGP
jgi:NAD(P)-dependent dehydrogenase (short-subunit alcohol dehydrogenase family)